MWKFSCMLNVNDEFFLLNFQYAMRGNGIVKFIPVRKEFLGVFQKDKVVVKINEVCS